MRNNFGDIEMDFDPTDKGYAAGMRGDSFESCPFTGVTQMAWEDGWHQGNEERIDREQWEAENISA